jgi:hypothetical protein
MLILAMVLWCVLVLAALRVVGANPTDDTETPDQALTLGDGPGADPFEAGCAAVQYSDQMFCGRCKAAWDVNDQEPPARLPKRTQHDQNTRHA